MWIACVCWSGCFCFLLSTTELQAGAGMASSTIQCGKGTGKEKSPSLFLLPYATCVTHFPVRGVSLRNSFRARLWETGSLG